jgi:hypothetical protein
MDVERTIEFLLEQQARFAGQSNQHDARLVKVEEGFLQVNDILLDVATSQQTSNEIVAVLAQKLVDLTTLVERHIANH